ncbi:hypothetical protein [Ligilactobacillus apodemi]|uniref:Polysaccharide polymerase n=1 Tax=Ligilactobacillus apodemi DSM 16634 = JCM 16172 TaxID=1423724 RepID=A0A0R1U275_9LACO|nr:hypothetical protein [Ligilactobacillus apodemi]KRL87446.1 hypothetical protein FC32_GL000008 [Ligilactobacillus apodemi DSM 16634 = JCM 16172]
MTKLIFNKENLFCGAFFVWCLYMALFITTNYSAKLGGMLQYIMVAFAIGIIIIKELFTLSEIKEYSFFRFSLMILFLLVVIKIMGHSYGTIFLSSMLFVISARDVSFDKILKAFIWVVLILFLLTIVGSKIGLVSSMYSAQNGRYRNSLGFSYVSFPSQYAFFFTAACLALKKKSISYWSLIGLLILDVYIYKNAVTSSPFVLSMALLGYTFVVKILKTNIMVKFTFTRAIATCTFILAPLCLWWLCFKAPLALFTEVDKFVNNRLQLSVDGIKNFGVSLFGQKISFITLDSVGRFSSNYNYIDSSYFQNLVVNGIVFTAFIIFLFTYVAYKSVHYRNDILAVVLIALSIHAMFDPQLVVLWYSPFAMLLSKYFSMDDSDFIVGSEVISKKIL